LGKALGSTLCPNEIDHELQCLQTAVVVEHSLRPVGTQLVLALLPHEDQPGRLCTTIPIVGEKAIALVRLVDLLRVFLQLIPRGRRLIRIQASVAVHELVPEEDPGLRSLRHGIDFVAPGHIVTQAIAPIRRIKRLGPLDALVERLSDATGAPFSCQVSVHVAEIRNGAGGNGGGDLLAAGDAAGQNLATDLELRVLLPELLDHSLADSTWLPEPLPEPELE